MERHRGLEPRLRLLGRQVPYRLDKYRMSCCVDLAGFEPAASAMPRRRATNCATSPSSGTRESNPVPLASEASVVTVPHAPERHLPPAPKMRRRSGDNLLSAVELTMFRPRRAGAASNSARRCREAA